MSDATNLQPRNSADADLLCQGMKAFRDGAPDDKTMEPMWRDGWRYAFIAHARRNPSVLTQRQRQAAKPKFRFTKSIGRKAA